MTLNQFLKWCDEREAAGDWMHCRAMAIAQGVIGRELTDEERKRYEVARLWRKNCNLVECRKRIDQLRPKPRRTYYTDVDKLQDTEAKPERMKYEQELQRLEIQKNLDDVFKMLGGLTV